MSHPRSSVWAPCQNTSVMFYLSRLLFAILGCWLFASAVLSFVSYDVLEKVHRVSRCIRWPSQGFSCLCLQGDVGDSRAGSLKQRGGIDCRSTLGAVFSNLFVLAHVVAGAVYCTVFG